MLKIAFNTVLGIALILIWLRFVDLPQIIATISKVSPIGLLPVFLFMFFSPVIRALRLKVFLNPVKKIKLLDLIFLNGVSQILNFFIPIRAGEIAKGVYLHSEYGLSLGKSIIWIFIDRLVDFLAVLGFAAVLIWAVPNKLSPGFALTVGAIFLAGLLITYLISYQATLSKKLFQIVRIMLLLRPVQNYFGKVSSFFLETFSILKRSPKDMTVIIALTVLAYGADSAIWYFLFWALKVPVSFFSMYLGQLLSALTYLIPAAPGYVGSAEASGLLVLSGVLGFEPNISSAMIVLFHICFALFVIIFGLISIFNLKIDLELILKKALKKA